VAKDAKFCSQCGSPIGEGAVSEPAQALPSQEQEPIIALSPFERYQMRTQQLIDRCSVTFHWTTIAEARLVTTQVNIIAKELRLLKTEIRQAIKTMHAEHSDQRMHVRATGWARFVGGETAIHQRAKKKEQSRQDEHGMLKAYNGLINRIDAMLLSCDKVKLEVAQWIADQKPSK